MSPALEIFQVAGDHTGERPYWDAATGDFYWIDVFGRRIHRRKAGGEVTTWHVPSLIGSLGLVDERRAVVTLHNGFFWFDFETGVCRLIGFPDPGVSGNLRLNDGKTDPVGRFVCCGADYFRAAAIAGIYSLDRDLMPRRLGADLRVGNGLAWSPNGDTVYFSDSYRQVILRARYDTESGDLGAIEVFATCGDDEGMPDGACVDIDGCLWVAMVYGGKLLRFTPRGRRDREIALPFSAPTSVAFGGTAMDTLYITSKSKNATGEEIDPGAGGHVFALTGTGASGAAEKRVRLP